MNTKPVMSTYTLNRIIRATIMLMAIGTIIIGMIFLDSCSGSKSICNDRFQNKIVNKTTRR